MVLGTRLLTALLLGGILGCYCYSFDDDNDTNDGHEITERNPEPEPEPDPFPPRGRPRTMDSRYNRQGSSWSSSRRMTGDTPSMTTQRVPAIDPFKCQSASEQNIADKCYSPQDYKCPKRSKYRTIDGTCNNLRRPWWGAVDTAHVRLMRPFYHDGKSQYRRSQVDGSELPSARLLSQQFFPDLDIPDTRTRMFLQFSQLVAHDTTLNPQETDGPKCCSGTGDAIRSTSGNCRPISVPENDPFYKQFKRKCLEYKRSEAVNCSVELLLPVVKSTHFIDASFVYGSTMEKARELRAFSRGQLKVRTVDGKSYLPLQNASECPFARSNCYDAGDSRINQHLDLAVTQTVWLRFHNYVAAKLIELNPHWSNKDELVYQEARRIVGAVFQHITYAEWLPLLIGRVYAKNVGLAPTSDGEYFEDYDPEVNPSTLADYAGGAFRGLHSLIPGKIELLTEQRNTNRKLPFSSTLQRPGDYLESGDAFDSTLRGLATQRQMFQDRYLTQEITQFLIDADVPDSGSNQFGDDLAARDIQRGRDFGLRPYSDYRELCGLVRPKTFGDLRDLMQTGKIYRLSQLFKDINDVDYYLGGLLESTIQGTLSSPSFRCIFVEAFYRYKYGDRYFYENDPTINPGAFTPEQLTGIKSSLLSQVTCIGSDGIEQMQGNVFHQPSEGNPIESCTKLQSDFDSILSLFQEQF